MEKSYKIALLISDSHLWGLWLHKVLKRENFLFEPILSSEIDESFPFKYRALFVPGGWSKNKLESLASWQRNIIKEFVREGGCYFGICGGASLAGEEGLSLVKIRRKKERVPSYSGPCIVDFKENPLFQGIKKPIFFLWFPPELEIKDPTLKILAKFKEPSPEAYTSDLCLEDHFPYLSQYEKIYGIPLNPDKMKDKPLLIEGTLEKGKVLLSLIHFDTPFCKNSTLFWKNLAKFFNLSYNNFLKHEKQKFNNNFSSSLQRKFFTVCKTLYIDTERLLNFAKRNFLFHQRYPFFYQWKRGIRGLEVLNLHFMLREILQCLRKDQYAEEIFEKFILYLDQLTDDFDLILETLKAEMLDFIYKKSFSKDSFLDEEKGKSVFGDNRKSYGGIYKKVINKLEEILVYLWRAN